MRIKKINIQAPFQKLDELKVSIQGIRKLITRYQRDAKRSRNSDYVIKREEKVEKLVLILADLNLIIEEH